MSTYDKVEIDKKRNYQVVKSNEFVQKSRYDLSVAEQRAIAYICSLIKPVKPSPETRNAPYMLEYEFNILDYAKVCGLRSQGGRFYKDTRDIFKRLMLRLIQVEYPDRELIIAWLDRADLFKESGLVRIRLNIDLAPFLFDLQEKFTAYGLLNILAMKSQYSIRIYELLHSHAYQRNIVYDIENLKHILMVTDKRTYDNFAALKRRILDPAMEEINKFTDLAIRYETINKGRKVVKIRFIISSKPTLERIISHDKVSRVIESEQ